MLLYRGREMEVAMRKLATIATAVLIMTGSAGTAEAQHWRGGWGYGGYYGYRHYGGWGGGGALAAGLIGGAVVAGT